MNSKEGREDMGEYKMWIRILSAIIGIPVLILVLYYGGYVLMFALLAVTLIGLNEFYGAFEKAGILPFKFPGLISSALIIFMTAVSGRPALDLMPAMLVALILAAFAMMIVSKSVRIVDLGITLLGIVYVTIPMNMLMLIYSLDNRMLFAWLVFIIAWAGDTLAYFVGIAFGKHKLCPSVSPKKSWEGAMGGLAGSISGAVLFGYALQHYAGFDFNAVHYIAIGFVGGIFAQLGDLSASVIKRHAGIKDFGSIIPGHGGILDRFDSILFVAPVVYYYIRFFIV